MERALDSMLIVYSLLQGHPASSLCENFIRTRSGWFTSAITILECKAILTKVYGVDAASATQKLTQFINGPLTIVTTDSHSVVAALSFADAQALDLADAVLLQMAHDQGAVKLATDDQHLAQISSQLGLTIESPFDPVLRRQVAAWESAHLPAKGLARVLYRVESWLAQNFPQAAQTFHSQTGGGSHLP
jgi:predicted nucleic acid-binding protein